MNRDDIIRMAKEAGAMFDHMTWVERDLAPVFERFANLVAAAEREAFDAKYPIQLTHDQYNAVINAALKDEREACAALCDKISDEDGFEGGYADRCAFAIRERGAP